VQKVNVWTISFVLDANYAINMIPAEYCRPLGVDVQQFTNS